jgi:aconitate hydratase
MGILPLEFNQGESADSHGLTGFETFNIEFDSNKLEVNQSIKVTTSTGKSFTTKSRLDTAIEIEYFKNGGILHYVLRNMANSK